MTCSIVTDHLGPPRLTPRRGCFYQENPMHTIDLIVRIGMTLVITTALPCALWGIYQELKR